MAQTFSPETIRFQLLYRNTFGGSLFYVFAIFLLLTTRDNPLQGILGWGWLLVCMALIGSRTFLAVREKENNREPSLKFIINTLAISAAITSIAWFPIGSHPQGPILFLFCFFLLTLGVSMVFHAIPIVVLLNNIIVLGTLTIYYLFRLDGSEQVNWITMTLFPLLFLFNVSLARQLSDSVNRSIDLYNEIKKMAVENEKIAEKAQAASRAKSSFLANISHEIRTPLNTLIGFSQILEGDQDIPDHCQDNIRRISTSGHHLLLLINDVLDMSKIEANKLNLDPETTNLRNLLTTVCDLMRPRAEDKGVDLINNIDKNVPEFVVVDPLKLRQVLLNLISNSVKFTEQGSINLTTSYDSQSGEFSFGVRDTGKGIREEDQQKLFRPFEQCRTSSSGGTGLGLAISHNIIKLMGGKISVESDFGKGSHFCVEVPLKIIKQKVAEQKTFSLDQPEEIVSIEQDPFLTARVLVVDDIPNNRLLLVTILKRLGINPDEASDGQKAIGQWQKHNHEMILMDKRMPNLDGYLAAKLIKQQAIQNNITPPKIIMVSADALSEKHGSDSYSEFTDGYIAKPFDLREVSKQLKQTLADISKQSIAN